MFARILATGVCLLLGMSVTAAATPIAYSESVSGDLGDSLPGTLLTLDVGVNTVSGTQYDAFSLGSDTDSFAFTVPNGTEVTQISYSFDLSTTGYSAFTDYSLDDGNALPVIPLLGLESIMLITAVSPVNLFSAALPLGPGTYGLYNLATTASDPGWSSSYTWTFNVVSTETPVPEPATLLLMGVGLVAGGVRRARRRSRG